MAELHAVYLDLRDVLSARVWDWLGALDLHTVVEPRPFCMEVPDPWECAAPPLGLELAMLLEQAREHSPRAMCTVLEESYARLGRDLDAAHEALAAWLAIGSQAGLPLGEYDQHMDRLRAEVGYWMAEATEEHGVVRAPTLLFDDDSIVYVALDVELDDPVEAAEFLAVVQSQVGRTSGSASGR